MASHISTLVGNAVAEITAEEDGGVCTLAAKFKEDGVNDKIADKEIDFIYTASNGLWTCETDLVPAVRPGTCSER